jgi:hypothetical protein
MGKEILLARRCSENVIKLTSQILLGEEND